MREALAVLVAAALCASVARAQWAVSDGQQLADAATAWGLQNSDATFALPAASILSLRNATFRLANNAQAVGRRAYANGTFTIQGRAGSVIDTGMRAGMVPTLFSKARLRIEEATLVNLCIADLSLLGVPMATPLNVNWLSLNPVQATLFVDRVTMYVPQRTLAVLVYLATVFKSPRSWETVWGAFKYQTDIMYGSFDTAQVPRVQTHELRLINVTSSPIMQGSWTLRALEQHNDTLASFMRAQGLVMQPRWCGNGSLVPAAWATSPIDPLWGPQWMADTVEEAVAGLLNATALAPAQLATKMPVPALTPLLPAWDLGELGTLPLSAPLILIGPDDPRDGACELDLSRRAAPLFNVTGPSGQLFVARLVLKLGAQGTASASSTGTMLFSALAAPANAPTASGNATAAARTGAMVELHNVTLVVPTSDFLALLTLATDGDGAKGVRHCSDAATLRQAALLQAGTQALAPSAASWEVVALRAYAAQGVNASQLVVLPQTPVPDSVLQACSRAQMLAPPSANGTAAAGSGGGDGDSNGLSPQTLGVIVACTVGGALLLAGAALTVLLVLRRRRASRYSPDAEAASTGKPGGNSDGAPLSLPEGDVTGSSSVGTPAGAARSAAADLAPESALMALLHGQERQLLASAASPPGAAPSAPQDVGSLHQAHEQLMSTLAASRALGGASGRQASKGNPTVRSGGSGVEGSRSSAATSQGGCHPREEVEQVATRLLGPGADQVTLQHVLGQGGNGTVYKGLWRGMPVAVKTMVFEAWEGDDSSSGGAAANKAQLRYVRAIMETALSASLGHPHVVATYHYDIKRMDDFAGLDEAHGQDQGGPTRLAISSQSSDAGIKTFKVFLVQELCTCSLHTALQHQALHTEAPATLLSMLYQVVAGLEYLHRQGVIHGDLTPGNILLKVDKEDTSVTIKLADFGLSQRLDAQATHVSNFNAGTPFYVAPEVVAMKRTSPASDIFSFGVVAWEMYSRTPLIMRAADGAITRNPLFPRFPAEARPPAGMEALIHRCLSPRPHSRPSATEVLAVLDRCLAQVNGGDPDAAAVA